MDVLRRFLKRKGYGIRQAMNITDIDDKIIRRCEKMGLVQEPGKLTRFYEERFKQDLRLLNVEYPDIWLRVTDHIPQMIEYIQGLLSAGVAYKASNGDIYFDVQAYHEKMTTLQEKGYGVFRAYDHQILGGSGIKRNATDFALWKATGSTTINDSAFAFEAPWSLGRPGWHLECSVMSQAIFGSRLDLHSGGEDLKFPHHENEIAQCRAANHFCCGDGHGSDWCDFFIHTGHITMGDEKMSKSLGNDVKIRTHVQEKGALHLRLLCLISRYSSPLDLRMDSHEKFVLNLEHRLRQTIDLLREHKKLLPINNESLEEERPPSEALDAALSDDLNTAVLLTEELPRLISQINSKLLITDSNEDNNSLETLRFNFLDICNVLGLTDLIASSSSSTTISSSSDETHLLEILQESRDKLRFLAKSANCPSDHKRQLYLLSDSIRSKITQLYPHRIQSDI